MSFLNLVLVVFGTSGNYRSRGVTVSTEGLEPFNPSSNLGGTSQSLSLWSSG
jgi:hypothetical protein